MVKRWLREERGLLLAWLVLFVVNLSVGIVVTDDPRSIARQGLLSWDALETVVAVALVYAYLLLLVRLIREPRRLSMSSARARCNRLSSWGYVWRSYLVLLLVLSPLAARTIVYLHVGRAAPPVSNWLLFVLIVVIAPPVAWLSFGRYRISLIKRHRRD